MTRRGLIYATLASLALAGPARAVPLDPNSFVSLGAFPDLTGITIDTDTLSMTGAGTGVVQVPGNDADGFALPEIAVFAFDGGATIGSDVTIDVTGRRALALLFQGNVTFGASVNASGGAGETSDGVFAGLGGDGGPGTRYAFASDSGFPLVSGGSGSGACSGQTAGQGFGAVQADGLAAGSGRTYPSQVTNANTPGGGGGGFGGAGGNGGADGSIVVAGGLPNGDLAAALHGGSSGGGGAGRCSVLFIPSSGGGGAGGGVEIGALTELVLAGGTIDISGGDGGLNDPGVRGGGGGSGGGLLLHAFDVLFDGSFLVDASGGADGGPGSGCGGGGRVRVLHDDDSTNSSSEQEIAAHILLDGGGACATAADAATYRGVATLTLLDSIGTAPTGDPGGASEIPAPASLGLLGFALAAFGFAVRRRP